MKNFRKSMKKPVVPFNVFISKLFQKYFLLVLIRSLVNNFIIVFLWPLSIYVHCYAGIFPFFFLYASRYLVKIFVFTNLRFKSSIPNNNFSPPILKIEFLTMFSARDKNWYENFTKLSRHFSTVIMLKQSATFELLHTFFGDDEC